MIRFVIVFCLISALAPVAMAQPTAWKSDDGLVSVSIPAGWRVIKNPKYALYIERIGKEEEWADCKLAVMTAPNLAGRSQAQTNADLEKRPTEPLTRGGQELVEFSTSARIEKALVREYATRGADFSIRGRELAFVHSIWLTGIIAICEHAAHLPKPAQSDAADFLQSLTLNVQK